MARRKNPGWHIFIPTFNMADHYVYFNDLLRNPIKKGISLKKEALGSAANSYYQQGITTLEQALNSTEQFNQIVSYLEALAENERKKEVAAVEAFKARHQEIVSQLPPFSPDNAYDFYLELTKQINIIRKNAAEYKEALRKVQFNHTNYQQFGDYMKTDERFRYWSDFKSLINNFKEGHIGPYKTKKAKKEIDEFSKRIQELAIQITQEKLAAALAETPGEEFFALASVILFDIEQQANQFRLSQVGQDADFTAILDHFNEFEQQIAGRYEKDNPVKKLIENYRQLGKNSELTRLASQLGIQHIDDIEKRIQELEKRRDDKNSNLTSGQRGWITRRINALRRVQNEQPLLQMEITNKRIYTRKEQGAGNLYEIVRGFVQNLDWEYARTVGSAGRGVDIFSIDFNYKIDPQYTEFDGLLNDLEEAVDIQIQQEEKNIRHADYRAEIKELNTAIDRTVAELEEKLQQLDDIQDFFIFHESVKLYTSIETGKSSSFEGRNMSLIHYIDSILSMPGAEELISGIDRDYLIFLGLNASKNAIGIGNYEPLTQFFSLFAAFLMFDDVTNMVKETLQQEVSKNKVNQVHLYDLNSIYVPASLLMYHVADAIKQTIPQISLCAKAHVSTSGANQIISDWIEEHHDMLYHNIPYDVTPADWANYGNKVSTETKIRITFLASFLRFIDDLSKI